MVVTALRPARHGASKSRLASCETSFRTGDRHSTGTRWNGSMGYGDSSTFHIITLSRARIGRTRIRSITEEPKDRRGEPRAARMAYSDVHRAAAGPQVAKNLVARLVSGRTISIHRQRAARCTFRPEDLTCRVRRGRCGA